jgi:hypothetical protein
VVTIAELIHSVIIILTLLAPGSVVAQGQAQGQGQSESASVNVFIVGTATARTHQIDLKNIEGESPTSNFVIKPEAVVQVRQGDSLIVFTQPINQAIDSVRIQQPNGAMTTLAPLGNNAYSLAGLPTGAHILDVIVDLGAGKKGAYETFLVILAQGQQPVQPTQVINRIQISVVNGNNETGDNETGDNETNGIIDNMTRQEPPPEECDPGFELVGDHCEPIICPDGSQLDASGRECEPLPQPGPGVGPQPGPDQPVDEPIVPGDGQGGEEEEEDGEEGQEQDQDQDQDEAGSTDEEGQGEGQPFG